MSAASFRDPCPLPRGAFRLEVWRRGELVELVDEPNMVVVGAEQILATLLAGGVGGGLAKIGFGTSMVPAAFGNTALTAPYVKALDSIGQSVAFKADFGFSLGSTEANGLSIGEFGLFNNFGVLFARKARTTAPIPKDATMALAGTWTIDFGVYA